MQLSKIILVFISSLFPLITFAQTYTVKLINHFNEPLDVTAGINPEVLPGFPKQFTLDVNDEREGEVANIQKRAFVNARDISTHKKYAFWAVGILDDKIKVWPYEARDVAFSVRENVIIFCTPDDYKKHHSCFTS